MEIIYKKINELIPYDKNAKKHDAEQIKRIALSLDRYGWKQPVVIDANNVIIVGHGRVLGAKKSEKWKNKPVPCVVADDLTEEEIREYRLADNKLNESDWDIELLDVELADIEFDMSEFGFENEEIEDEDYSTDFSLKDGDREPTITMSITFSDDEAEAVNRAIAEMKGTKKFKDYDNPLNKNGNGNALFLVVDEWLAQRI